MNKITRFQNIWKEKLCGIARNYKSSVLPGYSDSRETMEYDTTVASSCDFK